MEKVPDQLKYYLLTTDIARNYEQRSWRGNKITILQNAATDLHISFMEDASEEDVFPVPPITFGDPFILIKFDEPFDKVFLRHSAVPDGEIMFIIGTGNSRYKWD